MERIPDISCRPIAVRQQVTKSAKTHGPQPLKQDPTNHNLSLGSSGLSSGIKGQPWGSASPGSRMSSGGTCHPESQFGVFSFHLWVNQSTLA